MIEQRKEHLILLFFIWGLLNSVYGQSLDIDIIRNQMLSRHANNTAVIIGDSLNKFFSFEISPTFKRGNLNNSIEPEDYNRYNIYTEGIKKEGKLIFSGKIQYSRFNETKRKWCSIYEYNSRFPYSPFDTVAGDWNKNDLLLSAGVTKPIAFKRISLGLKITYLLSTGAKQKDPRPLTRNNEIFISPSIIYHINKKSYIGFDLKIGKGLETADQNFFEQNSSERVFAFTGLGSLTVSGFKKRHFTKSSFRPELLYSRNNRNHKYMVLLYFEKQDIKTRIKWNNRPKAETTINQYLLNRLGASFIMNMKKYNSLHFIKVNSSYSFADGKSIISTGTNEYSGILYENQTLLPYHFDSSIDVNLIYSFTKLTNNRINYLVKTNIDFSNMEINYGGGINNAFIISGLTAKLFIEKSIFQKKRTSVSLNVKTNYYSPINSELTMKTNYLSSVFVNERYNYYKNNRLLYGLGFSVLSTIKERNYKFQFSYDRETHNSLNTGSRQFFNFKIVTYI